MQNSRIIEDRGLYKIAFAACVLMLIIMLAQIIVFVASPPPDTVLGFFELYEKNIMLGLLSLDLLYLINNLLLVFVYLGLAAMVYVKKPAMILPALILGLLGVACYYPSNPAFEMLSLSNSYFTAADGSGDLFLASGETLLAGYTGTSFNAYYIMNALSLLFFSAALLQSGREFKILGVLGMAAGLLMVVPSSAGMLGMVFSLVSLLPWSIFVILLSIRFFQRSRHEKEN